LRAHRLFIQVIDGGAAMTFEEARGQLISALHLTAGVLDCKSIAAKLAEGDVPLAELELDSLVAMELCIELESSTGVKFDLDDLASNPSIDRVARLLALRASTDAR
jgi:acyl carrier protein